MGITGSAKWYFNQAFRSKSVNSKNLAMNAGIPTRIDPNQKPYALYEGVEYTDFWQESARTRLDTLEHAIVNELLPSTGTRIIDLGCGYGRLSDCYLDRYKQVFLFDASISLLQQAREKVKDKAWFIAGDINHLPFRPASFDLALMVRVFHHIPDSSHCLKEIQRILSGGSHLIFSYSNKRNAARMAAYLLGRDKVNPFSCHTYGIGTTLIRHHPHFVHDLLLEQGYRELRYRGAGVFDKIPEKSGSDKIWNQLGKSLAPLFGLIKIAPWIFCKAATLEEKVLFNSEKLIDLLQCPKCGGRLFEEPKACICLRCSTRFPIVDGIFDMRPV